MDRDGGRCRAERARDLDHRGRGTLSFRSCSRHSSSPRVTPKKAASTSGASAHSGHFPRSSPAGRYWATNLPYFPSLLYFAAGNLLFVGGPSWQAWSSNSTYFMTTAVIGLAFAVTVNVVGLDIGKWLNNAGGLCAWIVAGLLIVLGAVSWGRFGSATAINASTLVPSTSLKDVIFWSTIAFAFGGVESASTMGEEIRDARRTIPRAVMAAAVVITLLYLAGTLSILLAIPKDQVSGLQGVMQAMQAMTTKVGVGWLVPLVALLVTLNAMGGVGSWFAATARLPFVAGLDRYLPRRVRFDPPTVSHPSRRAAGAGGDFGGVRGARPGRLDRSAAPTTCSSA